jgi:hypothetical protein
MAHVAERSAFVFPAALALLAASAAISPALSRAAECGQGTVFDAASNTCVVAALPPPPGALPPPPPAPPPPPPPQWSGPRPYVSASICAPIRWVNLCAGI